MAVIAVGLCNYARAEPQSLFEANCSLCHQKGAIGVRGQFPRLAGRIAAIAGSPAGRIYLQQVVLFGMAGKVEVDGESIVGVMPPFAALSDDDLSAVLNYLTQLGPPGERVRPVAQFTAAEIAAIRSSPGVSPTQVNANRRAVVRAEHEATRPR